MIRPIPATFVGVLLLNALGVAPASAQAPLRKIGEMELSLVGVSATVDPSDPVVPKNTASGVRIIVSAGGQPLEAADVARFLGGPFTAQALLAGPGLPFAIDLPHLAVGESLPSDPLLLPLPPLPQSGNYQLTNVRLVASNGATLDVEPRTVLVRVIDQILITSVKTRALSLEEIKQRGIVLDSDDYLGFEFTLGLKLESTPVSVSFPVVFDRQGVPVPQPILPPPSPNRTSDPLPPMPTIVPMLLEVFVPDDSGGGGQKVPLTLANGTPIRIPSLLVIPGNVGFLKQFFSAQLFVANGAPVGSNLVVRNVTGTMKLPIGSDGIEGPDPNTGINDDPLALPDLLRDDRVVEQDETMPVLGVGPDGEPGTPDDVAAFDPGEQGQAEFMVRGEKEGYHTLEFDIAATLEGLPIGPVQVTGKASGGVLVRNPSFNMTFTVPNVVRTDEPFSLFVTVSNVGQREVNLLNVALDSAAFSGFKLGILDPNTTPPTPETGQRTIPTLAPGESRTLTFRFISRVTGKVVASYLRTDINEGATATTSLKFSLGVGERGVALSPDTLVLPSAVDRLPASVVEAAMRVLGQAWSLANSPAGTVPRGVIRTDRAVVTEKALALAEAGLRYDLGEPLSDSIRDLAFDFYGGKSVDPGFDQLLRQTDAGREFAAAVGAALGSTADAAGGAIAYEALTATSGSPSGDVLSFAVPGAPGLAVSLVDAAGRRTTSGVTPGHADVPGGVILPLGAATGHSLLGVVTSPIASPYVLELAAGQPSSVGASASFPRGDGTLARFELGGISLAAGGRARVTIDLANPSSVLVDVDAEGDGTFVSQSEATQAVTLLGPALISANIIGPETFDTASPFGLQAVLLLDRPVDPASAATVQNYSLRANQILAAKAQLSGRLVFLSLAQPEGPYVPGSLTVSGLTDRAGRMGATDAANLGVRLKDAGAVVSGRVLSADGNPVTTGSVTYLNQVGPCDNRSHGPLAAVRLGGDGRYEFRYVRRDPCGSPFKILTVDPVTGALRQLSSSVRSAGEQIVLDVLLFGRGSVTGTVSQGGQPVPGAQVVAFSGTDPQIGGSAITDGDGHYTIAGITVGPVNVRAAKGTGAGQSSGRIDRAGTTTTVDVNLDGGAIRLVGTLRKLEAGETTPVQGVYVYYFLGGGGNPLAAALTDSAGRYAFEGLPAGPYALEASLNLRDRARVTGIAAVDPSLPSEVLTTITHPILISIAPPQTYGTITGTVRLPGTGGLAAGVIVSVGDRGVLTDDSGAFTIPGIPVAPNQTVLARTRDGLRSGSASFSVFAADQPVTTSITLSGIGSAQFTVLDPAGQKIAGIPVRHFGPACADICGCVVGSTNSEGIIRFDDIPLGSVYVQVIRSSGGATDVAGGTASVTRDGMTGFGIVRFAGAGTVTGRVEEAIGAGAAFGADVTLTSRFFYNDGQGTCGLVQGISHRARTDVDGKFRFTGVNVGSVGVTAVGGVANPTPVGRQDTLTADGQQITFNLKLVNTIAGELRGTVFLPDGVTPAGAGIDVHANGPIPELIVKTNAEGVYRFPKILPEGTYTIVTEDKVTGGLAREQIYVRTGQESVHDQRLKGKGTVKVRVVNALDEAVETAFVRLRETDFPGRSFEAAIQIANQGVVTFDGVFEGPFSVEVSDALDRGGRASSVLPHPGDTVEIKVPMTVTGTVTGVFRMPGGAAIPLGSVSLGVNGRVIGQSTTSGTDPVGTFRFEFVPAGNIRVDAQDPVTARTGVGFGRLTQEGEAVTIEVVAEGLGTVAGTVFSNGAPQRLAHVDIVSGSFRTATTTDDDGRYAVHGVPVGRVNVTANLGNGFLSGSDSQTLLGDGDTVTIDVNLRGSGSLTGHVVSASGLAAPVSIVTVQIGGTGGGTFTTTTDGGDFSFTRVPAGAARLTVEVVGSIDRGTANTEVPVAATGEVTVQLNGLGSIEGHALDSDAQPVAGDLMLVGTGSFGYQQFVRVGTDGYFRFPELLAGPFTVSLTARVGDFTLYGTESDTLPAGETKIVEVQVQPSGTVTGIVRRAGGQSPAFGSQVTLSLDPFRGALGFQAQDDGSLVFRGVPLGPFTVRVSDPVSTGVALVKGRSVLVNGEIVDLGPIVLDDGAVAVTSVDPAEGATAVAVTKAIVATFSDGLAGTGGVSIKTAAGHSVSFHAALSADGLALTLTPNPTWPDAQEIQVTFTTGVSDIYGRPLAQSVTTHFRTVDLSAPVVNTIVPTGGAIQVGFDATVVVTFNEELDPAQSLAGRVVLAGPTGPVSGTSALTGAAEVTFTPASPLAGNATYGVTVNGAVDRSGNTQTQPFSSSFRTLDSIPPVLSLSTPANGSWVKTGRPAIQIFFSDALSGPDVATKALVLDGVPVSTGPSGNTIDHTPPVTLADGTHTLSAHVDDRAGNRGSLTASFSVDTEVPGAAQIAGLSEGQVIRGVVSLTATATDVPSGVARIDFFSDGGFIAFALAPGFSTSYNTASLGEGQHTLAARAMDLAGNFGEIGPGVPVVVDNHQMTLVITKPTGTNPRFRNTVVVQALASEPVLSIDFAVGPSGAAVVDTTAPYEVTLDLASTPEGLNTIRATAHGVVPGDAQFAEKTIIVDRTPPAAPDPTKITAEESDAGLAQVVGVAGAVEGHARVEVVNPATGALVAAMAAQDGSFATFVQAALGAPLSLVAIDAVGNRSEPTSVMVARGTTEGGVPLTGLAMWVRADVGVTNEDGVSVWTDQSDAHNDLIQPSPANRPQLVEDGFNGRSVLHFDGGNDVLGFTRRLTTMRTVFWVVREDPAAGHAYRSLLGDGSTIDFEGEHGAPGAIWRLHRASASVTNGETWLNGQMINGLATARPRAMSVLSVVTTGNTTASNFGFGRDTSPWHGDLAELLIYERPLSPGERQAVEDYLVRKYRPYVPPAGTPSILPAGGVFDGSTTVSLSSTTPGASIYYTLDGTEPTTSSNLYGQPFVIEATTTVKARAVREGYDDSAIATASFVRREEAPSSSGLVLWLRGDAGLATNAGGWITRWQDQSGQGNHAFQSNGTQAPQLVRDGLNGLPIAHFDGGDGIAFTNSLTTIRTVFWVVREDPASGPDYRTLLGDGSTIDFEGEHGAPGAIWRLNRASASVTNGQTWLNGQPIYGPATPRPRTMSVISLVTTGNTTASNFGFGRDTSPWHGDLAELVIYDRPLSAEERSSIEAYLLAKYAIGAVTAPVASPNGGLFTDSVSVTLATRTAGAQIFYTTDGAEPSEESIPYTEPIVLAATTTLKAKAFKEGRPESSTTTAAFTRDSDFSPHGPAGLKLWWRADAGVPTGFGDFWIDQSGNGNHGFQPSSSAVPRLVPDAASGLPAMRFDGGDGVGFTNGLTTIRTVFWVVREDPASGPAYRSLLGDVNTIDFEGEHGAPGAIWRLNRASASVTNGQAWLNAQPIYGPATPRPRTMSVISLVTTGNATANNFGFGRDTSPWHGDLAELVIYDRPLSAEERKSVEDYLLAKYEIGPVTAPVASPSGGQFTGSVSVTLTSRTVGAQIVYTTDGTEPRRQSAPYTGPLVLNATTILKAKAFKDDLPESVTTTASFTRESDFTPKGVAGLQLWWRADAGVPSGFGDYWIDQSGNANHGFQPNGSAVPRLIPNRVAGLPAMSFDGGDGVSFTSRLTTIRTVFWVVREDPASGPAYRSLLGDDGTIDFEGEHGAPGAIWRLNRASASVTDGQTWLNGQPITGVSTARPRTMSVISLVTTGNTTASNFGFGRDTSPWHGDLTELVIYDQALSATDRKKVEDYLRIRYWDVTTAAGTSSVSVSWQPRPSAVRYDVERSTTSGSGYGVIASGLLGTSFTDASAAPHTPYYYRVVGIDENGIRLPSREVAGSALWIGTGTGLTGTYYNNTNFSAPIALTRTDPTVNFNFGGGSPDPAVTVDNFSARWVGQVQAPATGDYTFATNSDDGVGLKVNGQLVIDNWSLHGDTLNTSAPLRLTAGEKYDIRLEFFEGGGGAVIRLQWSYPGQPLQPIPTTQLYLAKFIEGVVRDAGSARGGVLVSLFGEHGEPIAEAVTDAEGRYRFDGLSFRNYRVVVSDPVQNRPALYEVALTADAPARLNTPLAATAHTGVVRIHGRLDPTGAPAAGRVVTLSSWDVGPWRREITLDANGEAQVTGVSAGHFEVYSGDPPNVGWEDPEVSGGDVVDVNLTIGNRDWFPVSFTIADGAPIVVDGQGAVIHSPKDCMPFCGPFAKVNGELVNGRADAQRVQVDPVDPTTLREAAAGVRRLSGLEVTRRSYVPSDGRFMRRIEVLRNPTAAAITIDFEIYNHSDAAPFSRITSTSSEDAAADPSDRWIAIGPKVGVVPPAVTENALVASGPGARAPLTDFWVAEGMGMYGAKWSALTVPAGETVLVVSFMVEAPAGTDVAALADRLSLLTEPGALAGLTEAEMAAIVNLGLPGGAPSTGTGSGLAAAYYNSRDLTGTPVLSRVDATVDFDFGEGSPDPKVTADEFSARWSGQVQAPVTGYFRFATRSNDGVRLKVNGQLVIDNWTLHADTLNTSAPVRLTAGEKYEISLEFFDGGGGAVIRLQWSYPGRPLHPIPTTQLYLANFIEGVVRDAGIARGGVLAGLFGEHGEFVAEAVTDAEGRYRFDGLGFGNYRIVVSDPVQNRPALYEVVLTPDAPARLTTPLAATAQTGVVRIHGRLDPSGAPAAGRVVTMSSWDVGPWWREVTLDENGEAEVTGVSAGHFEVYSGDPPNVGWEDPEVSGGDVVDVNLTIGNRDWFEVAFPVTGGTPFVLDGQGAIVHSAEPCTPYCGPFAQVNDAAFRGRADAQRVQVDPVDPTRLRETAAGPRAMSGLQMTRRSYVPSDGRFMRRLDVIHNPSAAPITFDLRVYNQSNAAAFSAITMTSSGDDAADASDHWIVISPNAGVTPPDVNENALIIAGPGARAPLSEFFAHSGTSAYGGHWTAMRVEPGQTILVMSFMAEAPAGERDEIAALAERLSLLTEPDALAGLTSAEKAGIVNFSLPGGAAETGTGSGLAAAYYNSPDLTGEPVLSRVDSTVDFDFAGGSPDPVVTPDDFSARWTGQVQAPVTGYFRFATRSDDGVRLRVDGDAVIDNWTDHAETLDVGPPMLLQAGEKYDLSLEFREAGGQAVIRLHWSYPGQPFQPIPATQLYQTTLEGLQGVVRDASGARVPGAIVDAASMTTWVRVTTTADANGRFRFTDLEPGRYLVVSTDPATGGRPGRVEVENVDGQMAEVTITLLSDSQVGNVHVVGVMDGSGLPASGAHVLIEAQSWGGAWWHGIVLDESGQATMAGVPADVVYASSGAPPEYGWASGLVRAGETTEITVRIGNRPGFPIDLTGADGLPYFARASSVLEADGSGHDWECEPFCVGYSGIAVPDGEYHANANQNGAPLSLGGREVTMGPDLFKGIRMTRRTFVPTAGRFARFLDVFENTTAGALTFNYYVEQAHQSAAPWAVVTTSSGDPVFDGDDEYATMAHADPASPALAFVVNGPGAAVIRAGTTTGTDTPWTWFWDNGQVTLAPGQRVALLRFAVQRPHGQTQQVEEQAEALRYLTDPDALIGVAPEERALVINFAIPSGSQGTGAAGSVLSAEGTAAAGAVVRVLAPGAPRPVATTVTDAAGRFRVTGLEAGTYTVAVQNPATGRRGQTDVEVSPETIAEVTISLTDAQGIHGVVRDASGAVVPGAAVTASPVDGEPVSTTADAEGNFGLWDLEPGPYTLIAIDAVTGGRPARTEVQVVQGQVAEVTLTLLADDAVGSLHVVGVLDGSGQPAAGAQVSIEAEQWLGSWGAGVVLDATGHGALEGVPAGTVYVLSGNPPDYGWASGVVPAGGSTEVVLSIGNRPAFPIDLTGADGMPYFARASSVLAADGSGHDWECDPVCVGWSSLTFPGEIYAEYRHQPAARLGAGGREVVIGPDLLHGIRATRRTFVPPSGRFVRFLEILENTTAQPLTFTHYVEQAHNSTDAWQIETTSSGDQVFDLADEFVTMTSAGPTSPAMAFVVAGPGTALHRVETTMETEDTWTSLGSTVELTLAPGQQVILLRFAVQRPHGQMEAVQQQAAALRALTDPDALAGITAAERALIVNFVVP